MQAATALPTVRYLSYYPLVIGFTLSDLLRLAAPSIEEC